MGRDGYAGINTMIGYHIESGTIMDMTSIPWHTDATSYEDK